MSLIILTAEQAELVRGESSPGHVIDPVPLEDGTFAVSEAVLSDPAHSGKRGLLASKPKRVVAPAEFKKVTDDSAKS